MRYISQLPEPYKSLAEKNRRICNSYLICRDKESGEITKSFSWFNSPQGFEFWDSIYHAKTEQELPPIPEAE